MEDGIMCGGGLRRPPGFSQPAALLLLGGAGEIQIVPQVPARRSPHRQREFARAAFPGYRRPGKSSNRNLSCRGWESRVRAILPRLRGRICSRRIAAGGFRGSLAPLGLRALDRGLRLCVPRSRPCVRSVSLSTRTPVTLDRGPPYSSVTSSSLSAASARTLFLNKATF